MHFTQKNYNLALEDLRRALAIDPRHFKAINGLATIMRELEQKGAALRAYRKLIEVHPHWKDALEAITELEREVEGQRI